MPLTVSLLGFIPYQLCRFSDKDLEDIDDVDIVIAPKSHEELLGAMYTGVPSSVYVDGERISGPVFKARLENALGIPVRQPRIVRLYLDPE